MPITSFALFNQPKYYKIRSWLRTRLRTKYFHGLYLIEWLFLFVLIALSFFFFTYYWYNIKSFKNLGVVIQILTIFVVSLSCRNSIWTFLFGIPFEKQLFWHKLFATFTIIMTILKAVFFKIFSNQNNII